MGAMICAVLSIILLGCASESETSRLQNQATATPAANVDRAANSAMTNQPTVDSNQVVGPPAASSNKKSMPANLPTPQIGSGASDFGLFSQIRAAFASDAGLAGVIIEVKDGNATLSGKVATAAQKAAAARAAAGVSGVKSVKNNLQVSP